MKPEIWERIAELYHAACDLPPDEQRAFLGDACGDDDELRREIESLLRQDVARDGVLERVAGEAAPRQSRLPPAIGRYRIVSRLGEGGMGAVYEAEQDHPRRTVALKVLNRRSPVPSC